MGRTSGSGRDDDGRKFDSSYDRRGPALGPDGKPQLGPDGKPVLGEPQPIAAQYHLQWLTIFEGYVGDAVVAVLFLLAAMMTLSLQPFDRGGRTYPWLAAALITITASSQPNAPARATAAVPARGDDPPEPPAMTPSTSRAESSSRR